MKLKSLENRIPPPLVTLLSALIMWGITISWPSATAARSSVLLAAFFVVAGIGFIVAGLWSFRAHRTTVNPLNPEAASTLVVDGIYQVTRNPMYVGMFFLLLAWGLYLAHIVAMCWLAPWLLWMNGLQVAPEERAMQQRFGAAFDEYKNQVRRWL